MRVELIIVMSVMSVVAACKSPHPGAQSRSLGAPIGERQDAGDKAIKPTRAVRLDLDELSGIDSVVDPQTGQATIFGVGDGGYNILTANFSRLFSLVASKSAQLRKMISDQGDGSQWEGIALDAKGNVFVLEESPGAVYVFDSSMSRLLQTISLDYKHAGLRAGGFADNSLGEGIALLQNGHILILKEKDPSMLIEFGLEGGEAMGVSPETLIAKREAFEITGGERVTYKPLKWWRFTNNAKDLMDDASELAVGPDGILYALSDESNRLARLEGHLRVEEDKVDVKAYWDFPRSMKHPEALTFVGLSPVVGVDTKDGKDNIFVFSPLSE